MHRYGDKLPDLHRRSVRYIDTLRLLAPKLEELSLWKGSGVDRRMLARFKGTGTRTMSGKRKNPDGWY